MEENARWQACINAAKKWQEIEAEIQELGVPVIDTSGLVTPTRHERFVRCNGVELRWSHYRPSFKESPTTSQQGVELSLAYIRPEPLDYLPFCIFRLQVQELHTSRVIAHVQYVPTPLEGCHPDAGQWSWGVNGELRGFRELEGLGFRMARCRTINGFEQRLGEWRRGLIRAFMEYAP